MKLLVDIQGAQSESRFRGIGRYSLSLTKALSSHAAPDEHISLLFNARLADSIPTIRSEFSSTLTRDRFHPFEVAGPVREIEAGTSALARVSEICREAAVASLAPDVVLITSLFEGFVDDAVTSIGLLPRAPLTAAVLYDLIPLIRPDDYLTNDRAKSWYERKLVSLRNADLLLSISEYTRREAIERLGLPPDRILNIGAGLAPGFEPSAYSAEERNEVWQRHGIRKPFVMYTGGVDPRKNVERLIEAFASLAPELQTKHQLVIVGRLSEPDAARLEGLARRIGLLKDSLVLTGYTTDRDLIALYGCCSLFVFPSIHEGFGFPALEAMACGAPTIGSDTSSIPEVISLKEALFDPNRIDSISMKLTQGLTDSGFRKVLTEFGLARSRDFTWKRVAQNTQSAIRELCGGRAPQTVPPEEEVLTTLASTLARSPDYRALNAVSRVLVAHACAQSISPRRTPQIFFDVTTISEGDSRTGIQRCVRALAVQFLTAQQSAHQVQLVRLDKSAGTYKYATEYRGRLTGSPDPAEEEEPIEVWPGDVFLGIDLVADRLGGMEAWFRAQRVRGLLVYFVVYDLLPIKLPQYFVGALPAIFLDWLRFVSGVSDGLLCISDAVRDDLLEWLNLEAPLRDEPLRLATFPLGADVEASHASRGAPSKYLKAVAAMRARPTFLMVGTVEGRKGHAQVLEAFDGLWASGANVGLLIVGKPGWLVDNFLKAVELHPELNRRLIWVQDASDEFVEEAYKDSAALIAASFGEGFGLPLIEAARHNLPIIARDLKVFREVAGDCASYFSAEGSGALSRAIKEWLELRRHGAVPQSSAIKWATWEDSARFLLSFIAEPSAATNWMPDAELRPGTRLRFDTRRVEWQGWSLPETEHRWSNAEVATLSFALNASATWVGRLVLDCFTFGKQRIAVEVNDVRIGEWLKDTSGERWRIELPLDALRFKGRERVTFLLPDARAPGGHDQRRLAIALRSLELL